MLGKAVMVRKSPLERLASANPSSEIWWDSSPLTFEAWKTDTEMDAPVGERDKIAGWLERYCAPARPLEQLIRGATTTLPLSWAAVQADRAFWREWAVEQKRRTPQLDGTEICWQMYLEIVKRGAEKLLGVYHRSGFRWGYLAAEVDLRSRDQQERMKQQAAQISALASNVMVGVPVTAQGIRVIKYLTSRGISTNASRCFGLAQVAAAVRAVQEGLRVAERSKTDLSRWRSVVSLSIGRYEEFCTAEPNSGHAELKLTTLEKQWFWIAVLKRAIHLVLERESPSKLLVAGMRTGPAVGGSTRLWHSEKTAGADIVYACPGAYIKAVDHLGEQLEFRADAWTEPVPERVLEKLKALECFARAYEPEGLVPSQFSAQPAATADAAAFRGTTEAMESYVEQALANANIVSRLTRPQ